MPSSHLLLCHPLLLLPPIPPSIRVFSNESTLRMRWPKYWSFSFSITPSKEHPGLISFRMDWLDLLEVQGTLKSLASFISQSYADLLARIPLCAPQMSWNYANAQVTRNNAKNLGLSQSLDCCVASADKSVLFAFLLCHVLLGRCQGPQAWSGGWAWAPVHGTTHCKFSCQHLLTCHPRELVHCLHLREFSFCYFLHYCFSICPVCFF